MTPRKRLRRYRGRKPSGAPSVSMTSGHMDKLFVPRLSQTMLDLMDVPTVMTCITNVLIETACVVRDQNSLYKTGLYGQAQVCHPLFLQIHHLPLLHYNEIDG